MEKELLIHAFQLEVGDMIHCWEGWYKVFGLKGTYVRGRGLLVDIMLHDRPHRVECLATIKVIRHK